jgi:hypothetical protein
MKILPASFKSFLFPMGVAFLLASCQPTLQLQVLQPAQIDIPAHIQKIGIINRTVPAKDDRVLNVLEGILTGESIGADRMGAEQAIAAVRQELMQSNRYEVSVPAVAMDGNSPLSFKGPLDTKTVREICSQFHLDAIIVLELFDSDSRIQVAPRTRETRVNGKPVMVTDFVANANLSVQSAWKFYDDSTGNIVDDNRFEHVSRFSGAGPDPDAARMALPSKRDAINQAAFQAGAVYGHRIAPYWTTVTRQYYKKGNEAMGEAAKFSKEGRWNEAVPIWQKETKNSDPVVAGKAYYNLAIACEREGNLTLALEYATTAWQQYKNKWARDYINVLNNRVYNRQRLQQQMENKP